MGVTPLQTKEERSFPSHKWSDQKFGMFLGSFVNGQKDVQDQYQWRGEEYLTLSVGEVKLDQSMTKSQVGQGYCEAYHDVFGVFWNDEVKVGQPQWIKWTESKNWLTQEPEKQTNTQGLTPTQV